MASDIFAHVPHHVTFLFLFLCSCQFFLLLHITSIQTHHAPASRISHAVRDDKIQIQQPQQIQLQQQQQHHGKLRLLWSLNTSNEVWSDQQQQQQANNNNINTNNNPTTELHINQQNDVPQMPSIRDSLVQKLNENRSREISFSTNVLPHYQKSTDDEELGSVNFTDYTLDYIINQPYLCQNADDEDEDDDSEHSEPVYLLVLVHSHPSHKPQRDAIRATWGKQDFSAPVRFAFLLGMSDAADHQNLQALHHEAKLYRDVIVGNFSDTYRNLTIKALFGLQWAQKYCPSMQFMLKTDDDTYFNVTRLLQNLKNTYPTNNNTTSNNNTNKENNSAFTQDPPLIFGSLNSKAAVARRGLWQVNREQFSAPTYPSYCSGCAYVLSRSIISALLHAARTVPLLPIEDVYITGMLAEKVGSRCQSLRTFPYWSQGPSPKNICALLDPRQQLFGLHNVNYEKMYVIHAKVRSGHTCGTVVNKEIFHMVENNHNRVVT